MRTIYNEIEGATLLRLRALAVAMIAIAVLLVAVPTLSAQEASTPAFTKIALDLASGVVDHVLPFDVPFLFTGTVPAGTTALTASFREISDEARRVAKEARGKAGNDATPDFGCVFERPEGWIPLHPLLGQNLQFTIPVPRLSANKYYCFQFETQQEIGGTQLDAFRRAAAAAIDDVLRRVGTRFLSDENIEELRRQLIVAVTPKQSNQRLEVKRNSIFESIDLVRNPERAQDLVQIDQRFRAILQPILQQQSQKSDEIANFRNNADEATKTILAWAADDPFFAQLARQLSTLAPSSSAATLVGPKLPTIRQVAQASRSDLANEVEGGAPGTVRDIVLDPWSPGEVDDRLRRLTTFASDLETILAAVNSINDDRLPQTLGPDFTPQRLSQLAKSIGATQDLVRNEMTSLTSLQRTLSARQTAIAAVVEQLSATVRTDAVILATSVGDFSTRHNWYLSADLGLGWAWQLDEMFPYAGTNVYFRPVNKSAPLQDFGSFFQSFSRRFSAVFGVTVAANLAKAGEREALIGANQMLVLGAGLRLTDSLRVAMGGLVFTAVDPNPLVDKKRIHTSPFVSLSVDWDVRGTFTQLAGRATPTP